MADSLGLGSTACMYCTGTDVKEFGKKFKKAITSPSDADCPSLLESGAVRIKCFSKRPCLKVGFVPKSLNRKERASKAI